MFTKPKAQQDDEHRPHRVVMPEITERVIEAKSWGKVSDFSG